MSQLHSLELQKLEALNLEGADNLHDLGSFPDILPWDDIIFKYIFPCLKLKSLFLVRAVNRLFHDCVSDYFSKMRKLVITNMGPKFNSEIFHTITLENSSLRAITIRNSSNWITDENILPIIEVNANVRYADLSENTTLSDKTVQRLVVVTGPVLKALVLRDCSWLSSEMLNQVALNCLHLEKLDITGCWDIQDMSVINLSRLCIRLKHLAVAKIYGLTDHSICEVAKNLLELTHLNIQGCWRVTDKSIFLLAEYSKSLKLLQAKECRDISLQSLEKLKAKGVRVDLLSGRKKPLTAAHYTYMKGLPM